MEKLISLPCPIAEEMTESQFQKFCETAKLKEIKKGDRLFTRGEQAEHFYLLKEGKCALAIGMRYLDQEEQVYLGELSFKDSFGWSCLVEPYEYIYSAYCTQDGVVLEFSRDDLEKLMEEHVEIGYRFHRNLNALIGKRIRKLQELWIEEIEGSRERVKYWIDKNAGMGDQ